MFLRVVAAIAGALFIQVAFVSASIAQDRDPELQALHPRDYTYPGLSPDEQYVVYSSGVGFDKDIHLFDRSTGTTTKLTASDAEDSAPAWSPDGRSIVFQREDSTGNRDIWQLFIAGQSEADQTEINLTETPQLREQHPRVSPDGKSVLFDSNSSDASESDDESVDNYEIFKMDLKSGERTRLTEWFHWDMYPSMSPDESHLVWRRTFLSPEGDRNFEIMVKDLATGEITNISQHPAYDTNPHWSPSGDTIVFASSRSGASNLYIINHDGSGLRALTSNASESLGYSRPSFSFDGSKVVANRSVRGATDIVIVELN